MKYAPRHFAPHELLPGLTGDETWETLDPDLRAKLDDRLLETEDEYRELVDEEALVNDYARGGERQWCGLRTPACAIGAKYSQHRKGRAADNHHRSIDRARNQAIRAAQSLKIPADQVQARGLAAAIAQADVIRAKIRQWVAAGKLPHLGGVEVGVSWIHIDVRPRVGGKVLWFHA
jgi:hypothetical protein